MALHRQRAATEDRLGVDHESRRRPHSVSEDGAVALELDAANDGLPLIFYRGGYGRFAP